MNNPQARIISASDNGLRACACAARISTTEGTALQIFQAEADAQKDLNLVRKVLLSGHKSLIEHHVFTVAFDSVSAYTEQFLIEFRLASFTVKSRRYVDFSSAGFYVPAALTGSLKSAYTDAMRRLFDDYHRLLELGVPREDARFVLPYCFLSNLYVTLDARELVQMICQMRYGRGAAYEELQLLGAQLNDQLDEIYPGVVAMERARYENAALPSWRAAVAVPAPAEPGVTVLAAPADAPGLLAQALAFGGRFADGRALGALIRDARPRELECLNYTFRFDGLSLSCVTHFARHRIQSPLFEPVARAICGGRYVLPQSVLAADGAREIYERAFEQNAHAARALLRGGMPESCLPYLSMSGNTVSLMTTMNAREILHFCKLRACSRAQWEIRDLTRQMLDLLTASYPALFALYGPSCAVTGQCPEGRLSCGHPQKPRAV